MAESTLASFFFTSVIFFLKVSRFPLGLYDFMSVSPSEGHVASVPVPDWSGSMALWPIRRCLKEV